MASDPTLNNGTAGTHSNGNGHNGSQLPRAILYSWRTSVWATVPLLCLNEKGYSEEEYTIRQVDITRGENFSPSYLKINANGTVPTLVVPTAESASSDVATRYRSLRDTMTICEFLDQARNVATTHTVSDRPAPALAPATIEGKSLSDTLIALVHLPTVDPNFFYLSARSHEELQQKLKSEPGIFVTQRQQAIDGHIAEAQAMMQRKMSGHSSDSHGSSSSGQTPESLVTSSASPSAPTFEAKTVAFLNEKKEANSLLYQIYHGQAGSDGQQGFFDASTKAWTESLPDVLGKLEAGLKGAYALGDQVCLADLHIIAWLARLVQISGGKSNPAGLDELEKQTAGKAKIGPKMRAFWNAWIERDSFKKVWVQTSIAGELVP